jgi:hypothetical protein
MPGDAVHSMIGLSANETDFSEFGFESEEQNCVLVAVLMHL